MSNIGVSDGLPDHLCPDDTVDETPGDILQALQFDPVPVLQDRQVRKWRQTRGSVLVEFLTPAFGQELVKPLPALVVSAQGQNYLNFLIPQPIPAIALWRSGADPPARALCDPQADRGRPPPGRPDDLQEAYLEALSRGPRWRERLE
jgi:hypothetical protein